MKTVVVPYELLHDIGSYLYTVKPPSMRRKTLNTMLTPGDADC
jgi:hypothetical protein